MENRVDFPHADEKRQKLADCALLFVLKSSALENDVKTCFYLSKLVFAFNRH